MNDAVNHPSHYNQGAIEVIDFIEDRQFNFNVGNAVKYICRAPYKGKYVEDLQKAVFYLKRQRELNSKKKHKIGHLDVYDFAKHLPERLRIVIFIIDDISITNKIGRYYDMAIENLQEEIKIVQEDK